jgi:putative hydrolase of the HAD superfamily
MPHPPDGPTLDHVETWVFDLDNTLYPARFNLFDQVDRRIGLYIQQLLKVDAQEARKVQKTYFREHGTTLRGLMDRHAIDPGHFLDYVHDIDYGAIPASPALHDALTMLPGRKLVFTNGSVGHAERVLDRLGVMDHFETVFDIAAADYLPKPRREAYDALCRRHALEPKRAAMFEDIARNLEPAHALGMTTVWIRTDSVWGQEGSDAAYVHHVAEELDGWLGALVRRRRSATLTGGGPPVA